MTNIHPRQAAIGGAFSVVLIANLFLFMPFTLYVGNGSEFTVSFGAILKVYLPLVTFLVGVLAFVAMLLPRSLYLVFLSLIATASILMWIQGNLLVWDYGLLDGRSIDWAADTSRGWLEIGIWVSVLVLTVVANRRLKQHIIRAALVVFFLQATVFAYNWMMYAPEKLASPDAQNTADVLSKIYQFSSKKNVVHIIADGFQSDIFAEIRSTGELGTRLTTALDGFTFFPEHMGVFPYTHMTIPAILTGQIYRNDLPIKEHMASTVGGESILSVANDAGYEIDLVVPEGALVNIYSNAPYTNMYRVTSQQHVSRTEFEIYNSAKLLDLTLFRLSPHFLKKHIYNEQLWLVQSFTVDEDYKGLDFFSHTAFLREFSERISADRPEPVYKLIHLMLSHNPMVTTGQCTYAGRVLRTVRETVMNQATCGLIEVVNLLESMKRLGIYDDATIVLMGDHGAWVPPVGLRGVLNPDGESIDVINPAIMALVAPLFAVKRPGESGPMRINDAPSWIVDTAATIAKATGLEANFAGKSVFDLDSEEPRERRVLIYQYKRSEWTDDYLAPIEEFIVNGSVFDSSSWRYTVTHLQNGRVVKSQGQSPIWRTLKLN